MYTIYALIDPENNCIRYIGCTGGSVYIRLYEHLADSIEHYKYKSWSFSRKHSWLLRLYREDKLPVVITLFENVKGKKEARKIESRIISHFQGAKLNNPLFNGWVPFDEKRARQKTYLKGIKQLFTKHGIQLKLTKPRGLINQS